MPGAVIGGKVKKVGGKPKKGKKGVKKSVKKPLKK